MDNRTFTETFRAVNRFKVPRRMWGSWTLVGKHTFNKLFEHMMENQEIYHHTENKADGLLERKHWRVVAWNAAVMAAGITSRGMRRVHGASIEKVKDYT